MNSKNKVLVTGGAGFIGSFLVEALMKRGHEVTVFDMDEPKFTPGVNFIKGDITDREAVDKAVEGKDVVFHYAGMLGTHETVERAHAAARINILGALNVYDAALKHGKIKVFDVTKPNYWRNPYTITKIAAEEFGLMYRGEFGLPVVFLRYFNIFGPRQKTDIYQKAVPTFILEALKNEPIVIYGDGSQGTDHLFVEDAIEATMKVFESGLIPEKAVEIGSGVEVNVNDIAKRIIKLTGSKSEIKYIPMRRGETGHTRIQADISYLSEELSFVPKHSLEEGLLKTIEYYKKRV
jgi:UDP-glucose 4-epimerase